MPLKVQFIYSGGQANGWTETFWLLTGSLTGVQGLINQFVAARAACLGLGCTIEGARVTDPDVVGAAAWYPVNPVNVVNAAPRLEQDLVQSTVLVRIQDAQNLYRRSFEMSGIPDVWLAWNQGARSYFVVDAGRTAIAAFGNRLINSWALQVTNRQAAAVNLRPVQGVAYAPPAVVGDVGVVTVTSANHGYAVGDIVRISKVQGTAIQVTKGGPRQITSVTANTFTYNFPGSVIQPVTWIKGGLIRRKQPAYVSIGEVQILRVGNRKRGRAFFVQRGRRPANR